MHHFPLLLTAYFILWILVSTICYCIQSTCLRFYVWIYSKVCHYVAPFLYFDFVQKNIIFHLHFIWNVICLFIDSIFSIYTVWWRLTVCYIWTQFTEIIWKCWFVTPLICICSPMFCLDWINAIFLSLTYHISIFSCKDLSFQILIKTNIYQC